jgi:hypothetical protein
VSHVSVAKVNRQNDLYGLKLHKLGSSRKFKYYWFKNAQKTVQYYCFTEQKHVELAQFGLLFDPCQYELLLEKSQVVCRLIPSVLNSY